jgi:hypothetical protein
MDLLTVLLAPLFIMLLLGVPAGIISYVRYAGLPRYPGPVFPRNQEEAARVRRHWQRHTAHRKVYADVRLEDGSVIRDVCFDADSFVAVTIAEEPVSPWFYRRTISAILILGAGLEESARADFKAGGEGAPSLSKDSA